MSRLTPGRPVPVAFDAVAGYRAFNQRVFEQGLEPLGRLAGVEGLLAAEFAQVGQVPARTAWNGDVTVGEQAQGVHGSAEPAKNRILSRFNSMDAMKYRLSKTRSANESSMLMDSVKG